MAVLHKTAAVPERLDQRLVGNSPQAVVHRGDTVTLTKSGAPDPDGGEFATTQVEETLDVSG